MQHGIMSVVCFKLEPAHLQARPWFHEQLQRCDLRRSFERAVEQSNPASLLLSPALPDGGFFLRGRYVVQPFEIRWRALYRASTSFDSRLAFENAL